MLNQLDKILNFVKRTGDKAILFRDEGEFVVMELDDYYNVVGDQTSVHKLSEEELLKKINREIAIWRESQREFQNKQDESFNDPFNDPPVNYSDIEKDNFEIDNMPDQTDFDEYDDDYDDSEDKGEKYDELNFDDEDDIPEVNLDDLEEQDEFKAHKQADDDFPKIENIDDHWDNENVDLNNFGYQNPRDTKNFSKIPPPPDIR